MIVYDPYWMERENPSRKAADSLWVNLDKPSCMPFGFGVHPKADIQKPRKKKKGKKGKRL